MARWIPIKGLPRVGGVNCDYCVCLLKSINLFKLSHICICVCVCVCMT